MRRFISPAEEEAIEAAVREAERGTSGEIVAAVVEKSSGYEWIGYRSALLGWLAASFVAIWLRQSHPFTLDAWELFALQAAGIVLGWLFSRIPFVLRLLVPSSLMVAEVREAAEHSFLKNGLANTRDRTGVLVFVSVREHCVQILADKGIHDKLGESFWDEEARRITAGIKRGEPGNGMAEAVRRIGEMLKKHFPALPDDANELPDQLRKD